MGDGELGASEDVVETFSLRRVQFLDWSGRTRSGAHKATSRRTAAATTATSATKTARRCETKNLGSDVLNRCQRMTLISYTGTNSQQACRAQQKQSRQCRSTDDVS